MKNNKGITLIIVIMTVILLVILVGLIAVNSTDTFKNSKIVQFKTYMKAIQKKVDILVEEGNNYLNLGAPLSNEQKTTLQAIINNNNQIVTRDVTDTGLRYFSSNDIENIFEISGVDDEIVVNFSNRDVISLNGIEKNDVMHYVEYTLY